MDDQRARAIIADHFHLPLVHIRDDAEFVHLGADSLDMVSLTMRFEEEFNTHIPEDAVEDCRTVGDALAVLRSCLLPA
ncbi:MAG: acyl carrier protein [Sphingomicrobium sp.]